MRVQVRADPATDRGVEERRPPESVPVVTTAQVLALQRTAGNVATGRLLQRQVGEPQVRAGNGTTEELRAERERLERERASLHHSTIEPDTEARYNSYTRLISRLDVLLAERGNSTLADASVELTFDGHTLTMTGASTDSWTAVSGRPGPGGTFDYSPGRQRMQDVGPIPAGGYWLDPRQLIDLRERWLYSLRYEQAWGTHRITVHPFDTTHTFGRGGFFVHGGTTAGSAGCIDLTSSMAAFASRLGATPPGTKVKLTVAYPAGP